MWVLDVWLLLHIYLQAYNKIHIQRVYNVTRWKFKPGLIVIKELFLKTATSSQTCIVIWGDGE